MSALMSSDPDLAEVINPLKESDHCDRCGAQAYVRFTKVIGATDPRLVELLFCAHHAGKHEMELVANGWIIHDERERLHQ